MPWNYRASFPNAGKPPFASIGGSRRLIDDSPDTGLARSKPESWRAGGVYPRDAALDVAPGFLKVYGFTRDSAEALLPGCTVELFYEGSKLYAGSTVSDANAYYEFLGMPLPLATEGEPPGSIPPKFFVRATKAGTPVAGVTVNTAIVFS